jgi:hypothetical protein
MKSKKKPEVPHWIQELGPPPTMVATVSEVNPGARTTDQALTLARTTADSIETVPVVFSAMCMEIKGIGPIGNASDY